MKQADYATLIRLCHFIIIPPFMDLTGFTKLQGCDQKCERCLLSLLNFPTFKYIFKQIKSSVLAVKI